MTRGSRGPKATREALGTRTWVDDAACRMVIDPDVFFPIAEQEGLTLSAKRVCALCPVQSVCLAWALANGMDAGIWGGLTEQERRVLKRQEIVA